MGNLVEQKQFQIDANDTFQRKLQEARQANEFTRISKDFEGVCYGCLKNRYVQANVFDVCERCVSKRANEPILLVAGTKMHSFCFFCERHQQKIFTINARICERCDGIISRAHERYRLTGRYEIDPFWRSMRSKFGKDYQLLMSNG